MTVINPNNTIHTLNVVPRFYPDNDIQVSIYNEATSVTNQITSSYSIGKGKLNITFPFSFTEKDSHQIKVTQGSEIVYRGKLFTTKQTPKDYKQTKDLYTYS